ncbi:hypothetical protein L195_g039293, partial [Trifolium pratense]
MTFHSLGTKERITTPILALARRRRRLPHQSRQKDEQKELERAKRASEEEEGEGVVDSQPLAQHLWDTQVLEGIKVPHLPPSFDGKTDILEHLIAVGTQTAMINAPEHLKCKLLSGTFKDVALRWYMNLPKKSIESYADFHKKFIHQFAGSKHVKVISTSLFSICQNHAESLRDYLARFSEATIKVSNPNQEMFVAAFHNGLRVGHFNESLAQKPASSMQEINKRAECYIKGEESNAEKRQRDAKEKEYVNHNDHQRQRYGGQQEASWQRRQGNPYYKPPRREVKDYPAFREYTSLNKAKVHVSKEILTTGLANLPPYRDRGAFMGPDGDAWCAYHRCRGHSTEKCFRQRDLIEE